jgi:hypothetical protein
MSETKEISMWATILEMWLIAEFTYLYRCDFFGENCGLAIGTDFSICHVAYMHYQMKEENIKFHRIF